MLRTPLASERIQRRDSVTGVRVIQLTSYPLPSAHFLYSWPSITPDNQRVVFFCQRFARRNAPWDLFRVDTDGLNLYQLTEVGDKMEDAGYYGRPASRLTLDGRLVYAVFGKDLCSVDIETGRIEVLQNLGPVMPDHAAVGDLHISGDGERLFVTHSQSLMAGVLRFDATTNETVKVDLGGYLQACDPTGPRLVVSKGRVEWGTRIRKDGSRVVENVGGLSAKWLTDENGREIEYFCPEIFAHATLLGRKLVVQGCGKPPDHCIWLAEKGNEPRKLCVGPYFWHSGASWSGEWIVADSNWPDEGLQLVHVPTGNFATLCHAGATQDHYEFGHPHPALSQDGSICVFRSDRSGCPQIYLAHIPPEFQERVVAGESPTPDQGEKA